MIYLQLFLVYLKIGLLGFGGGYAMLSMIQFEVVEKHGWMTLSEFADVVALSQMTPGPISINCATYVGYQVGGIIGSLLASMAIVMPSLVLLYFVLRYLFKNKDNFIVDYIEEPQAFHSRIDFRGGIAYDEQRQLPRRRIKR